MGIGRSAIVADTFEALAEKTSLNDVYEFHSSPESNQLSPIPAVIKKSNSNIVNFFGLNDLVGNATALNEQNQGNKLLI